MSLPPTVSEEQFVRVVGHIAKILYRQFGALHGTQDDFHQQVALWALEAMPKYDPARPLDGYIYRHVKNRALNYIRDHYHRSDPPCAKCAACTPCGEDGAFCKRHTRWVERNRAKANLARPIDIECAGGQTKPGTAEVDVAAREMAQLIDERLPIELRADYLRMLAEDQVPLNRRLKVQRAVAEIIGLEAAPSQKGDSGEEGEQERVDFPADKPSPHGK